MLFAAGPISRFVERHPTMKILALAFLIAIGVLLVFEGWNPDVAHDLHLDVTRPREVLLDVDLVAAEEGLGLALDGAWRPLEDDVHHQRFAAGPRWFVRDEVPEQVGIVLARGALFGRRLVDHFL